MVLLERGDPGPPLQPPVLPGVHLSLVEVLCRAHVQRGEVLGGLLQAGVRRLQEEGVVGSPLHRWFPPGGDKGGLPRQRLECGRQEVRKVGVCMWGGVWLFDHIFMAIIIIFFMTNSVDVGVL